MGVPETTFVRRKEIFQWLGITKRDLYRTVVAGLIHPVTLPGSKYRKYLTKEIQRVFTKGVKYEEMGMAKVNPSARPRKQK